MYKSSSTPTSLTFTYGANSETVISNVTDLIVSDSIVLTKESLETNYFLDSNITYIISIENNSELPLFNVRLKEDLGTYPTDDSPIYVTPLKYMDTFKCYLNGKIKNIENPKSYSDKIVFEIDCIPKASTLIIVYLCKANAKAPLSKNDSITNTSYLLIPSMQKSVVASSAITPLEKADIKIIKQIKKISESGVDFNLSIYNYGNTPATNVIIKDTFEQSFSKLKIFVNSQSVKNSDYSYLSNKLTFPTASSDYSISVPAATFSRDKTSGKFSINPGVMNILIKCII